VKVVERARERLPGKFQKNIWSPLLAAGITDCVRAAVFEPNRPPEKTLSDTSSAAYKVSARSIGKGCGRPARAGRRVPRGPKAFEQRQAFFGRLVEQLPSL